MVSKIAVFFTALTVSGITSADVATGLIAHWSFDDCKATDASGNGHVGIIKGNPKCVTGVYGKALQFNGISDFIEVNDAQELRLSGTDYTLSGWVLLKSYNESFLSVLIAKRGTGNRNGYIWGITGNGDTAPLGREKMQISGGIDPDSYSTKANKLNAWRHFVIVYEAETQTSKMYINSILDGTTTNLPSPNLNTAASLRIAMDSDDTNPNPYFLNGKLDDLRIYNRAFTATEVAELYNIGQPISGTVKGLQQIGITCTNTTTGQQVTIPSQTNTSWDCKKAGLKIQPNQTVNISIDGKSYQ